MKKFLAILLALVMCFSFFTGCRKTPDPEPTPTPEVSDNANVNDNEELDADAAQSAIAYLKNMYKNVDEITAKDFQRVGVVPVGTTKVQVVWTVDVSEDLVKIVVEENGMVTIDVNEECTEETPYVLTATVTDADGKAHTLSWNHILPAKQDSLDILKAAYALAPGQELGYEVTLTGVVSSVKDPYDPNYGNISVWMVVDGHEAYPILCYRLKGTGVENLTKEDTITVTGTIVNYNGTIEFNSGCVLDAYEKGDYVAPEAPDSMTQIVDEAYALGANQSLEYTAVLTGVISEIKAPYDSNYGNISVWIKVAGREDKPILCYRMKGAGVESLEVNDTITVSGIITNYVGSAGYSTIEYTAGCSLLSVVKGSGAPQAPSSMTQIVDEAYALGANESLLYEATLTGVISEVKTAYSASYGNISVWIQVAGREDYPILCYRLKDGSMTGVSGLAVGDTITVKGYITNYVGEAGYSTIEYKAGCTLEGLTKGDGTTPEPEPIIPAGDVVDPVAGTAYKFGMAHGNLNGAVYYLKGGMDGYYMATTTDPAEAIDVYVEETTGGYYFYTVSGATKQYINMVVSGTHVNGKYDTAASTVYTYNSTSKTLIAVVNGENYWFGTRNDGTYTTMGPCAVKYAGFYGQFYGVGETAPATLDDAVAALESTYAETPATGTELPTTVTVRGTEFTVEWKVEPECAAAKIVDGVLILTPSDVDVDFTLTATVSDGTDTKTVTWEGVVSSTYLEVTQAETPVVGTAYKFGLYQATLDKSLYFAGSVSDTGFLNTIDDILEATDVYVEDASSAAEGAVRLYFLNGTAKQYIEIFKNSNDKIRHQIVSEPTMYYTYDTDAKVYVAKISEKVYYTGTYNDFSTFNASETWRITGDNAANVGVSQFVADFYTYKWVSGSATLEEGVEQLKADYADGFENGAELPTAVTVRNTTFTVSDWTVTAGADAAEIVAGKLVLTSQAEAVEYTLTATVTDAEGGTETVTFTGTVPALPTVADAVAKLQEKYAADHKFKNGDVLDETVVISGDTFEDITFDVVWTVTVAEGAPAVVAVEDYTLVYSPSDVDVDYTLTATITKGGDSAAASWNGVVSNTYLEVTQIETPEVGTAYKLGSEQKNVGKVLYFAGTTANTDYYLTTTEDIEAAVDVYLETVEGGYRMYFMDGETKTYIDAYLNGTFQNARLTTEPTAVFTYDTEYGTMVTKVDGVDVYIGTYKTYETLSVSKKDYISTSFPSHFYTYEWVSGSAAVAEGAAQLEDTYANGIANGTELPTTVQVRNTTFTVSDWTVTAGADAAEIVDGKLVLTSQAEAVEYTLTATVTDAEGGTETVTITGTVPAVDTSDVIANWGTRGEVATELSDNAEAFYAENDTSYDALDDLSGDELYEALQTLMSEAHEYQTTYGETRYLYCYTDCMGGDTNTLTCFYSGLAIGPEWDSGSTWNREHCWPVSHSSAGRPENGDSGLNADLMTLRPVSSSLNSSRGNKAYGVSSGYYNPNENTTVYDLRGDVARIVLYSYVRWEQTNLTDVIESVEILLDWMVIDPVDTWELGRNDSVESVTGTRNVFVDYPELAFLLFGEEIPADMETPSGEAGESGDSGDEDPVVTGPFQFYVEQANLDKTLYFNGTVSNGYLGTTETAAEAAAVYKEQVGDKYYLYFMDGETKTYIEVYLNSSNKPRLQLVTEATNYYTYSEDAGVLVMNLNGTDYYIGTYSTYVTLSASSTYYITGDNAANVGVSQFVGQFADYPVVTGPFQFYVEQANLGKTLYFNGTVSNGYLGTTETAAEAAAVYKEQVGDKYYLYFMDGETKTYIEVYLNSSNKPRLQLVTEATNYYTYSEDAGVLVMNLNGTDYYIGTYSTYVTLSASSTYYITGNNATNVGVSQFVGQFADYVVNPEPDPDPDPGVSNTTVTVSVADYATTNGWTNGTQYSALTMDENVTVTASGGQNTGKYYTSGEEWRIYQTENPSIVVEAAEGKSIVSVKITYANKNTGVLTLNGSNIASGTVVDVNASSVTFGVGNTGTANNGQVKITAIEVVYAEDEPVVSNTTVTVSIADYADANSWANGTMYNTLQMDENVTVTASGGQNTGKYYTSGEEWRTYQTENPSIVVEAAEGKSIVSVKITYANKNTGVLTLNGSNIASGTVVDVNASSITFGVGNTGTANNGQVKITAIEVVYN